MATERHPYSISEALNALARVEEELLAHTSDIARSMGVETSEENIESRKADIVSIQAVLDAVNAAESTWLNAFSAVRLADETAADFGRAIVQSVGVPGIALVRVAIT